MRDDAVRVVYQNRPYLLTLNEDGMMDHAFGPFTPGTEPNLSECAPEIEVRDPQKRAALQALIPLSPKLPMAEDTLAGG